MSTTLLDYSAAAALLNMSQGGLRALVSRNGVPHYRISERVVRFDERELLEWLRSRRVPARSIPHVADGAIELAAGGRGGR
jgi:excisionase family DNA binding protein